MNGANNLIGKVLQNRYEILEVIGIGGMAAVFKAHCRMLDRFVAVKVLKQNGTAAYSNLELLQRISVLEQALYNLGKDPSKIK